MRGLPKDVLKMVSGLILPSGLAGHRGQLCSVRNDHPGNPSKKKQADNLNNSRPSNLSTQPLPTLPYTEQSHQRPSVIIMTPSEAPTTVSRRQLGMPVLETIGSVTSSGSVELSRAPVFSCSTPKDSGRSDSLLSRASDTSNPLIGQGGTVPPVHPRRISRSGGHPTIITSTITKTPMANQR